MAKPYDPKDFYYRKAKKAGLRARSAFKIEEILQRHRLLGRGDAVLDLGAAPGGFLQILADAVGEKGVAVGVDLVEIRNLGKHWVRTAQVDLLAPDALERIRALHPGPYRLVTSDMAPKTIGIKVTDEARSLELVRMALDVADRILARGGAFVAKVFMGGDFPGLKRDLQQRFESFHIVRPEATRESSYEVYVLGKGFKGSGLRPQASGLGPTATATETAPPAPEPEREPAALSRDPRPVSPGPWPVSPSPDATSSSTPTSTPTATATPTKQRAARKPPAKKSPAKKPPAKKPAAKKPTPKRPAPRRRSPRLAPPSRARR